MTVFRDDDAREQVPVNSETTFEEWYAGWKALDPLRSGPDHPSLVAAMLEAFQAGVDVGLAINY